MSLFRKAMHFQDVLCLTLRVHFIFLEPVDFNLEMAVEKALVVSLQVTVWKIKILVFRKR